MCSMWSMWERVKYFNITRCLARLVELDSVQDILIWFFMEFLSHDSSTEYENAIFTCQKNPVIFLLMTTCEICSYIWKCIVISYIKHWMKFIKAEMLNFCLFHWICLLLCADTYKMLSTRFLAHLSTKCSRCAIAITFLCVIPCINNNCLVNALEATFWIQSSWKLIRTFISISSWPSSKLDHMRSKTRYQGQIEGKSCEHWRQPFLIWECWN